MRQTTFAKPHEIQKNWFIVDADGQRLGRMAVDIATVLMGKHRPDYTPHIDTGDFVIVTNAERGWVELSCRKYFPWLLPTIDGLKILSARSSYEQPGIPLKVHHPPIAKLNS